MNFKIIIFLLTTFYASKTVPQGIKIQFNDNFTRPIKDPSLISMRRSFWAPENSLCYILGSSTGALIAHRLKSTSTLTVNEKLPGYIQINLPSFVNILTSKLVPDIAMTTQCPLKLLSAAAEEICLPILCSSRITQNSKEYCLAVALKRNGVVLPALSTYFLEENLEEENCDGKYLNIRGSVNDGFYVNPEEHVALYIDGLQDEILNLYKQLQIANLKPNDLPFPGTTNNKIYLDVVIYASVISGHISKTLSETTLTRQRQNGAYDVMSFLSHLIKSLVEKLHLKSEEYIHRCHNAALKITLFWLINNNDLIKYIPMEIITIKTLEYLGLGAYYTANSNAQVNFKTQEYNGLYIKFRTQNKPLTVVSNIVEESLDLPRMLSQVQNLISTETIPVPDDLIKFVITPLPGNFRTSLVNNKDGDVGSMPKPDKWFNIGIKTETPSNEYNGVFLTTLAAIIGSHVATTLPDMGLLTQENQPGFKGLINIDVYEIIQDMSEILIQKMMSIIPLSINEGFHVLNGAFKTAKFCLNLDIPPNEIETKILISLGFKYSQILEFYPDLKNNQVDLWALPSKQSVLYLWVKPILNVNLNDVKNKKMVSLTNFKFPKVLKDFLEIMKAQIPGLDLHNLGNIRSELSKIFPWDPERVLSFLLDPSPNDGFRKPPNILIEPIKTYLTCPGHLLCPSKMCIPPTCGSYLCVTSNSWCYSPPGIRCPGSMQCPVQIPVTGKSGKQKLVTCPGEEGCLVKSIKCPGNLGCPNNKMKCPGDSACPLEIPCPGPMCPDRYTKIPQIMLPCPQHPDCRSDLKDFLFCTNETSCRYSDGTWGIATAITNAADVISLALAKQKEAIILNTTATANVYLGKQLLTSAASSAAVNNTENYANAKATASDEIKDY